MKNRKLAEETASLATIRDWLRYCVTLFNREECFYGQCSDNAYDEAAMLILGALKLPHARLEAFLDARLLPSETAALAEMVARRAFAKEPVPYILKEAWLGGCSFYVDRRVIVPRSYFTELIPDQLDAWFPSHDAVGSILDLCTGSGCLAILLAHAYPDARVDAVELSPDAFEVAKTNVERHGLQQRVSLFKGDAFEPLAGLTYDLIVTNPPYEPASVLSHIPAEFRHEPEMALVSDVDGMGVVNKILHHAREHLNPGGILVMEIGGLRERMEGLYTQLDFHWLPLHDGTDAVCLLTAKELEKLGPATGGKPAKKKAPKA